MIRDNNPGNIRPTKDNWQGKIGVSDRNFIIFDTLANGYRAMLINLYNVVRNRQVSTIDELGAIWAPNEEPGQTVNMNWPNNVSKGFGSRTLPIQFTRDIAGRLAKAISIAENSAFDQAAIDAALQDSRVMGFYGTKFGWTPAEQAAKKKVR